MYHSLYMWKSCSEPTTYGPHIRWSSVTLVQGGILADNDQMDTHVLKWNPAMFGYPKSLHIWATRDWVILSKLRFDAIYPSVAILVSRQLRAAYWVITTKTLVADGTLLTQSFSFLKDWEIMYHSLYMWNLVLSQRLTDRTLADVVSRQFRAAYSLITTKTLVVDGTLLTQNLSFLKDREITYH